MDPRDASIFSDDESTLSLPIELKAARGGDLRGLLLKSVREARGATDAVNNIEDQIRRATHEVRRARQLRASRHFARSSRALMAADEHLTAALRRARDLEARARASRQIWMAAEDATVRRGLAPDSAPDLTPIRLIATGLQNLLEEHVHEIQALKNESRAIVSDRPAVSA
jgi:hypothetical protein